MVKLDFSALNKIGGMAEARTEAQKGSVATGGKPQHKNAQNAKKQAFTSVSGGRNYNDFYRAAHDYHESHHPPVVVREFWRAHEPGKVDVPQVELDYWEKAAADVISVGRAHGDDPFLTGLLLAVYDELEREYTATRNNL